MKINKIIELCEEYGESTTLGDLKRIIQGNKKYKCPNCKGKGYTVQEYNAYPNGLPDSGWVYKPGYKNVPCDLCHGVGYTENQYKPKMVQDGWESEV